MKKFTSILLSFLLLTSCYTTKQTGISTTLDSFLGKKEAEIIMHFGPPSRTTSDGLSGKILIYENQRPNTMVIPGSLTGYYPMYATSGTTTSFMQFYVNKNDEVYHWRTNYPETEQVYDKKKSNWLIGVTTAVLVGLLTWLLVDDYDYNYK